MIFAIYQDTRTVFRLIDIALLTSETNFQTLNRKLNYYVKTGKLNNPRKGIYTKTNYDPQELACKIYTPSYISLELVLQKAGIIFQYDSGITSVSYLRRDVVIDGQIYSYRKIKGEILTNREGIFQQENDLNIASPERAFLDMLYLNPKFHFDNLHPLNKETVFKLLSIYSTNSLAVRVIKLLQND